MKIKTHKNTLQWTLKTETEQQMIQLFQSLSCLPLRPTQYGGILRVTPHFVRDEDTINMRFDLIQPQDNFDASEKSYEIVVHGRVKVYGMEAEYVGGPRTPTKTSVNLQFHCQYDVRHSNPGPIKISGTTEEINLLFGFTSQIVSSNIIRVDLHLEEMVTCDSDQEEDDDDQEEEDDDDQEIGDDEDQKMPMMMTKEIIPTHDQPEQQEQVGDCKKQKQQRAHPTHDQDEQQKVKDSPPPVQCKKHKQQGDHPTHDQDEQQKVKDSPTSGQCKKQKQEKDDPIQHKKQRRQDK